MISCMLLPIVPRVKSRRCHYSRSWPCCCAEEAGKEAVDKIKAQSPHATVSFVQLDISKPESVRSFADWARKELGSSLQIVVNNAGDHSCYAYQKQACLHPCPCSGPCDLQASPPRGILSGPKKLRKR